MAKMPFKSCKVLTCTILCGLPKLDEITGFNDLVRKIVPAEKITRYIFAPFLRIFLSK